MMHTRTAAALAAGLMAAAGCATARNYASASGPVFADPAPVVRSAPPLHGDAIRIVTFNIKFARHVEQARELLATAERLQGADVLVLQEMDEAGTRALARAFGMNQVYVPSAVHPASHRDFGVAILSRWPLTGARKVPLPHQHWLRRLQRAAATAVVQLPGGPVRVYAVHFESPFGLSGPGRRDQARAVVTDSRDWSGPVVVAGDFNGRGAAEEMARAGFVWLTRDVHDTAAFLDLDHVLARGLCPAAAHAADKVADTTNASDHAPVWAVVRPCVEDAPGPGGTPVPRLTERQRGAVREAAAPYRGMAVTILERQATAASHRFTQDLIAAFTAAGLVVSGPGDAGGDRAGACPPRPGLMAVYGALRSGAVNAIAESLIRSGALSESVSGCRVSDEEALTFVVSGAAS